MAEITKITTHVLDAKDRLIEQYRDEEKLPNFHAILEIFAQRFQDVENILENYNSKISIFNSTGFQLDQIGSIVGLARTNGNNDEQYRALLFIKIMQNNAQGTGEQLINLTRLLTGSTVVQYVNLFNATLSLYLNVDINPTYDVDVALVFYENIKNTLVAGVTLDSINLYLQSEAFELGNIVDEESQDNGLSSLENPTIGGRLTKIYTTNHQINSGKVWIEQSIGNTNDYTAITFSESHRMFVAISPYNPIMTSYDGLKWDSRTSPVSKYWNGICSSQELNLIVAVGTNGIMTSSDGINWTQRTSPINKVWCCVCWSKKLNKFVAMATVGTEAIMTSSDGINWTAGTTLNSPYTRSICWSEELNLFVVVGDQGFIMTSPDAITWTQRTPPVSNYLTSVCWSKKLGLFVAVSSSGTLDRIITSSDGITWTTRNNIEDNPFRSVCWSEELSLFVAVASSGTNRSIISSDGINWSVFNTTVSKSWYSLCWSSYLSMFCAVRAFDAASSSIIISPL